MKKLYEEPKYIVWQLETENLEALTGSGGETVVNPDDLGDLLEP